MDKIIEILFEKILKEIELLRRDIKGKTKSLPVWKTNPGKPATENQLLAITKAGGDIWEGMTQQDVSNQFKEINSRKNHQEVNFKKEMEEPKISDSYIEKKPLTQKEISEIGEENLL